MATNQTYTSTSLLHYQALLNESQSYHAMAVDDYIVEEYEGVVFLSPDNLLSDETLIDYREVHAVSVQNPVHGDAYWDGNQVIFFPESGYSGQASFEYSIMDKQGTLETATVYLTVMSS